MSLVLNMVGGGSGGGISGNTAVLEVVAPVGSSVSITNGTTTKTQTAADGHPISDRQTVEAYIFPVGSDEFGTWTITATRGTETNTTTVTISAIMDYVVYIGYHVPIGQYQEVEYIANTGSSWINPSVAPAVNFSANLRIAAQDGNAEALLGMNAGGSGNFRAEIFTQNNHYALYSVPSALTKEINHAVTFNELVDMEYSQTSSSVSLTAYGITVTNSCTVSARQSCSIFRYYGTQNYYQKGRVQRVEIYNNGVLARDMWACYRLRDSVAGMWDKVSETFFTNAGSGTFTVGADV